MTISLKFYADQSLTLPLTQLTINHLVDGSTDPQTAVVFLGSTSAGTKFQRASSPGVAELSVVIQNATVAWSANAAKAVNNTVRTTAKNGYRYKCTAVSGSAQTGANEPTWPTTPGQSVTDGTVTWVNDGKIHESSEVKLASTLTGLSSAVAGAPLSLGTQVLSGVANAIPVYLRVDDATGILSTLTELQLLVDDVVETAA